VDTTHTRAQSEVLAACSFCGKPNTEVERLVAGPGVYICDECVGLCNEVLGEVVAGAKVSWTAPWASMTDGQLLSTIPAIAAAAEQVEKSLRDWVGELRRRGVTWARIGEALGMTRQSAWERFSGEE
jgi:hypothetical protein